MSYKGDYTPPVLPPRPSGIVSLIGPALMVAGLLIIAFSFVLPNEEKSKEPVVIEKVK